MIAVTAATGNVGAFLVRELAARGAQVRALVRNRDRAPIQPNVDVCGADLDDDGALRAGFAGVDSLFLLSPGPDVAGQDARAIAAARATGVRRVVLLSSAGVPTSSGSGPVHEPGERALRASGLSWTTLRPGVFMSNILSQWLHTIRTQHKVFLPTGDGRDAPIHPADIAAVAAHVLSSGGHDGKIYELSGPTALSASEQTAILSRVAGYPIEYVPIDESVFRAQLEQIGVPPAMLEPVVRYYALVRAGEFAKVSPVVGELLGRSPKTLEEWARENAAAFG